MDSQKIHNNYFLKKAHSKTNLKTNKNKIPFNKSHILYNNQKIKDCINEEKSNNNIKSIKSKEFKIINNNSISTDNQDSITTTNKAYDSDSNNLNTKTINKEVYIKKLEKKIQNQAHQLSQLLEYKDLCEKKIKELSPNEILPLTIDSLNQNSYTNRDNQNSKKCCQNINNSYGNENIRADSNDCKNYEKTIELNINHNNDYYKDKYNNLYIKYVKILDNFKKVNNSNANIEISKLKNNLYKLQTDNDNILDKLNQEREINKILYIKIKNLEKIVEDNDKNNDAKEWKEQADMLRKDLVLSQALVNSLKSEIEILNKNNKKSRSYNNKRLSNSNTYKTLTYNNNDKKDNYEFINNFVDKDNNYKTINQNNNSFLINENNFLKKSLYNKNMLISNVLEENNKLNNLLKTKGINIPNGKDLNNGNNRINNISTKIPLNNIEEIKNNLSQYENKIIYFNDYISNIKKQIFKLHQDLTQITNNVKLEDTNNNDNNNISTEILIKEIKNVKNKIKDINIDFYNLDYSNDIKFLDIYMSFIKILIDGLTEILKNNKNYNLIHTREINSIIDLFELSKAVIKDDNLKKTLTDIFNITQSINRLYKQKYLNNNDNNENTNKEINDLDKILISQEKELELIKKSLFDISNLKKTYYFTNNYNNNILNTSNQINYQTENNINYKPNFRDNNNMIFNLANNNNYRTINNNNLNTVRKKYSNSREKIINRPYI